MCRVAIASAPKPTPARPSRVTPTPIWASAAPQNDSGSPAARRSADAGRRPGRHARVRTSVSEPMMTKIAMPAAIAARIERPCSQAAPAIGDEGAGGEGDRQTLRDAEQIAALPGEREADRRREGRSQQKRRRRSY